jgi:YHS domain-containing protein
MATDPVCGMKVDEATSEKTTYQGKTYYFCSAECKQDFNADPAKYIKQPASTRA